MSDTKKQSGSPALRSRAFMYTQQIKYSNYKDIDDLYKAINKKLKPKEFAVVCHDQDTDDKGKKVEEHLHAMLAFSNARSLNHIAKLLGEKPQAFEIWNDKTANGFAYLCHRTEKAKSKYQYEPSKVKASFDYPKRLDKITKQVAGTKTGKSTELLDAVYRGEISKSEAEENMSGTEYGKLYRQLEAIDAKQLEREAVEFNKKRIEQGIPITVIWAYGRSGTGKTSFARAIAEQKNRPYYISGSSRDIFQKYKGEHTVILDEFRANTIAYPDLLKILDPYQTHVMLPSRYQDKYLACDLIIITSPYSPWDFYKKDLSYRDNNGVLMEIDRFDQLERRITMTLYLDQQKIYLAEYNESTLCYENNPNFSEDNVYSSHARKQQQANNITDSSDLFQRMVKKNDSSTEISTDEEVS